MAVIDLDALVVGAGMSGIYMLYELRKAGYKAKIVEAGTGLGGVWHWNNYPGARVDIKYPHYQLNIPEVYKTWEFSEYFPDQKELQRYFQHIDSVLDISKDTYYKSIVTAALWNDETHKWTVTLDNGHEFVARYFLPCLGISTKCLYPDWPGLQDFQGETVHPARWPSQGGPTFANRHVGVIGTGASGVQVAQTAAREAAHLTVFVRIPNIALPMRRRPLPKTEAEQNKHDLLPQVFATERYSGLGGNLGPEPPILGKDLSAAERTAVLDRAYAAGGFAPMLCFSDVLVDPELNRFAYDDWARRTRARMTDPVKRDLLVPREPPHAFLGKRASLEQDYYEQMDRPNVTLVDLKTTSVEKVVSEGVRTMDGTVHELDLLVVATGFDMFTGPYDSIKLQGVGGELLERKWKGENGVVAHLGMAVHRFPNLFMVFGPLSPNVYAVSPSAIEQQCEWIVKMMQKMDREGKTRIEATATAEEDWTRMVSAIHAPSLRDKVDSYYIGANVPGKKRQALSYNGGLTAYGEALFKPLVNGFEGFEVS